MFRAFQVTKKLAGQSKGTATWATNVGNEVGQVLITVLTDKEGYGLSTMVDGIVDHYSKAAQPPPEVLYDDRDCCGDSSNRRMFHAWPMLQIRLDISRGCMTDVHALYGVFMGRLSRVIFEWSENDLRLLSDAKRGQLIERHLTDPTDDDIVRWLTKHELALHCRRKTRSVEETTRLLGKFK